MWCLDMEPKWVNLRLKSRFRFFSVLLESPEGALSLCEPAAVSGEVARRWVGFQFLSSSSRSSIFSNCCSRRVTPDARRALWEAVRCLAPSLTGSIIIMITWPKPAFGWLALGRIITFHYSNIRSLRLFGGEKTATHQQISKNVTDRSEPLFKPAGLSLCAVSAGFLLTDRTP